MTQVLNVFSPVTGFLSSLRFPTYYDRNYDRIFAGKKPGPIPDEQKDAVERTENIKAFIINSLPFFPILYSPSGRLISCGSSLVGTVRYLSLVQTKRTSEHYFGVVKNLIELVGTFYRLKVGLFIHAAMDLGESIYRYTEKRDWHELLPAISSGLYLTTLLPTSKKVRDSLVFASLAYQAGYNFYRTYHQYTVIDKATEVQSRDYYALFSKGLLGVIRLVQAGKIGYQLTRDEQPVQRTVVVMRSASKRDPATGGLTVKGKEDARAVAAVVGRVTAENGGKPLIFVSPKGNAKETGELLAQNLKLPTEVKVKNTLAEKGFGERKDERANRVEEEARYAAAQSDPNSVPVLIMDGDLMRDFTLEQRALGGSVSEVFDRRPHNAEMYVVRLDQERVDFQQRIRAKEEAKRATAEG